MNSDTFRRSLAADEPDPTLADPLAALWWDSKGDWERAHAAAQRADDAAGAWVHAYLHRREGDLGNAGYWYRRAGRPVGEGALDAERAEILAALLALG